MKQLSVIVLCLLGLLNMFIFQATFDDGNTFLSIATGTIAGLSLFAAGAVWMKTS